MPPATPYKASLHRARVVLDFHPLDRGLRHLVAGQEIQSVSDFCSLLRTSKLMYFQNDRQEPGAFDEVANQIAQLGDEAVKEAPQAKNVLDLDLALETIRGHVEEIRERIATAIPKRHALDHHRLGPKVHMVTPMSWARTI